MEARYKGDGRFFTRGQVYKIIRIDEEGDMWAIDNDGDEYFSNAKNWEIIMGEVSRSDVEELRRQLAEAEQKLKEQQRLSRAGVIKRLTEIKNEMVGLENEAKELAETVGLVFYYSKGYDEWSWIDSDNWSYSSADC